MRRILTKIFRAYLLWPATLRLLLCRDKALKQLVDSASVAEGVVTRLATIEDGEGVRYDYPHVVFYTAKGERIEFVSPSGFLPGWYSVGTKVKILYHPKLPTEARIVSFVCS